MVMPSSNEERNLAERADMLKDAVVKRRRPKGSTDCGFRAAIRRHLGHQVRLLHP